MKVRIDSAERSFNAVLAESFFSKFMGMRFRSSGKMLFDFGRKLRPRIDMLFVQESLYLYFLDSERLVVDLQEAEPWSLHPFSWKTHRPREPSRYLLESFEELELEEGEVLEFEI